MRYSVTVTDYKAHTERRQRYDSDKAALSAARTLRSFFQSPERVGAVDVEISVHDELDGELIFHDEIGRHL